VLSLCIEVDDALSIRRRLSSEPRARLLRPVGRRVPGPPMAAGAPGKAYQTENAPLHDDEDDRTGTRGNTHVCLICIKDVLPASRY
jgi:hypothetical protein